MVLDYKDQLRSRSSDGDECEGLEEIPLMNSEEEPDTEAGSLQIDPTPICHTMNTPTPSKLLGDVVKMWRVSQTPGRRKHRSLDTNALSDVSEAALSDASEATETDIPAGIELVLSPSTPVSTQITDSYKFSANFS